MENCKSKDHIKLGIQLVARLERLSADSYWAHQASGVRGSLLKYLEKLESNGNLKFSETESLEFELLLMHGYRLLERAARQL